MCCIKIRFNKIEPNIECNITGNILVNMGTETGVVANSIQNKLQTALEATHLEVINESYMHNVPKGAETHFKVVVVSDKFDGLALIKVSEEAYDLILCLWNQFHFKATFNCCFNILLVKTSFGKYCLGRKEHFCYFYKK